MLQKPSHLTDTLELMIPSLEPCLKPIRSDQKHPRHWLQEVLILKTLGEILGTFPAGSDERLEALAAWRQAQDRLAVQERDTKPAVPKPTAPPKPNVEPLSHVAGASDDQRRKWGDRKDAAQRQREAEAAAAIRARVTKAVELTYARLSAVADPEFRQAKMVRLAEIQASLAAKDPKTLAVISRTLGEIEARLARLTLE